MTKLQAIVIAPEPVHAFLQNARPEWDLQTPVESLDDFNQMMQDGKISRDSKIILIASRFFDSSGETNQFESFVARMSEYALVGILDYDPDLNSSIISAIDKMSYALGTETCPYYFIDKTRPLPSIDESIEKFISTSNNEELVSFFSNGAVDVATRETQTPKTTTTVKEDDSYTTPANGLNGKVIAVTSSKGGAGKSTVAISLASYLAKASKQAAKDGIADKPLKVLIIDFDIRDGQLGFFTGIHKPTILATRTEGPVTKESLKLSIVHNPNMECDMILAPRRPRHSNDTPPPFYAEVLQVAKTMYDYVIIDTSINYLDPLLEEVGYPQANLIIFVSDLSISSVFGFTRWIKETTTPIEQHGSGVDKKKIGLVLNKIMDNVSMDPKKILEAAQGVPLLSAFRSFPTVVTNATNQQHIEWLLEFPEFNKSIHMLATRIVPENTISPLPIPIKM